MSKKLKVILVSILIPTVWSIWVLFAHNSAGASGTFDNPHGNYVSGTDLCAKCHTGHSSFSLGLLRQPTQRETCYACHGPGTGVVDVRSQFGEQVIGLSVYSGSGSFHPVPAGLQLCTDCHNPHLLPTATPRILSVGESAYSSGNRVCGVCHGQGSLITGGDILTPFTGTPHDTSITDPSSGTQIKCVRCHQPHGSPYDSLLRTSIVSQTGGVYDVTGNNNTVCFACHQNEAGKYSGQTIYNQVYHGSKMSSTVAQTAYPGTSYAPTLCLNCHEPHGKTGVTDYKRADGNALCFGCHTDGTIPPAYSYRGSAAYAGTPHISASVYGDTIPVGSCLLCHAVHGQNGGSGAPLPKQLRLTFENVCFGGSAGACHGSAENSDRNINIYNRFTVGSNMTARHSINPAEQSAGGTKVECVNCHDPHLNNATAKVVDPQSRYSVYNLVKGFTDYISDTGAVYMMIKARHDGTPPAITSGPTVSNMTATGCQIDWTTGEYADCIVEYGPNESYGSQVSATALNPDRTQHRVTLTGLIFGQNYYFRVKATDRVGNYTYSTGRWLDSTAPLITSPPSLVSPTGTSVTITWMTNESSTSYVDFDTVEQAVYGYNNHPGDSSLVTNHSVLLTGLTTGQDYQYQVRSTDARGNTVIDGPHTFRLTAPPPTPDIKYEPDILNYAYDASVTLECYAVSDPNPPVQYFFQISTVSNFSTIYASSGWVDNPSWTTTVSNYYAVTYYWRVKARNAYGMESAWSSTSPPTDYDFVHNGGDEPKWDSCPFIFVWNGTVYEYVSDMSGPVINVPKHIKVDANKRIPYYLPVSALVPDKDNRYRVKIRSTAPGEIDIIDQIGLVLVDHPPGYEIASANAESSGQFMKPARAGQKFYAVSKSAVTVKLAVDRYGRDVTRELSRLDGVPAPAERRNFAESSSYVLDFGKLEHPEYARLVLDGWTYFKKEIKVQPKDEPRVEVINKHGRWEKVRNIGFISGDKKTMVVDLAGAFKTDDHRVRIFVGEKDRRVVLDRVRMDQSPPVPLQITYVPALSADLHFRGPANQVGATFDNPVLAKDDVKVGEMNLIFYGKFTKYGDVRELLAKTDDMFVIMQHGDEILAEFENPPLPPGMERSPVLMADFYYKQTGRAIFDASVKLPVEPLPFHKMSRYPYPASEKYPDDEAHRKYREEWLTREYRLVDGKVVLVRPFWESVAEFLAGVWKKSANLVRSLLHIGAGPDGDGNELPSSARSAGITGDGAVINAAVVGQAPRPEHYSLNTNYVLLQADTGISTVNYNINSAGAEMYQSSTEPTPSSPGNDGSAQKSLVAADDSSRWTTSYYAPNTGEGSYNYQMFKFVINEAKSKLTGIKLYWKGYGEPTTGYNTTLYIWNFTYSRWDQIYNAVIGSEVGRNIQQIEDFQPYCTKCHGGTVPPGIQLGTVTRNIAASYPTDYHGGGTSYDDSGTAIKSPFIRGNASLSCVDCHDLHGSQNAYHLRESINGQAVNLPSMAVANKYDTSKNAAILTYCQSCHAGTLDSFHMAKCLSCHRDPGAHDCSPPTAGDFSRACTYCHTHGGYMPDHGACHCTLGYNAKAF